MDESYVPWDQTRPPREPYRPAPGIEARTKGAKPAADAGEFRRHHIMLHIETPDAIARWHVLWTRSHCEQLVHDQLAGKQFELFLPKFETWAKRAGSRSLS